MDNLSQLEQERRVISSIDRLVPLLWVSVILICVTLFLTVLWLSSNPLSSQGELTQQANVSGNSYWVPPDTLSIPDSQEGELIRYGRELVLHTSAYLGPKGKVKATSNGLNCTNCHRKGGTQPFGINYGAVASTYPRWRARSGTVVDVEERINECIERSLNGTRLHPDDKELKAMAAYLKWIGKDVPEKTIPKGAGLKEITFLNRSADPVLGRKVFEAQCTRCHGENGEGLMAPDNLEWIYPPLYGEHSYNTGAGLYRLYKFARFVKYNMPEGVSFDNPVLTDEEAWDVAAYVNSMPRPVKDTPSDWPDISKKPFDYPFGPYADGFSEKQHKYGPFKEMRIED